MKRIYLSIITLLTSVSTFAQWVQDGSSPNYYLMGSVGIGVQPVTNVKLAVAAGAGSIDFTGLGTQSGHISIQGLGGTGGTGIRFGYSNAYIANFGGSNEILALNANGSHVFLVNGVEKMRLNANGFGIGTATPGAKLDVQGGTIRVGDGAGGYSGFYFNTSTGLTQENNNLVTLNGALQINSTAGADSYILGNGNVGINTTNTKGYKLAVNGSIIANSFVVKMYPWADYVFKKDYKLMSLQDLKSYIEKNHHLPEIPTEKEIAEKGLDLGEINKLLTKKIEELTLYMIYKDQQLKEIDKKQQEQTEDSQKLQEQLAAMQVRLSKLIGQKAK